MGDRHTVRKVCWSWRTRHSRIPLASHQNTHSGYQQQQTHALVTTIVGGAFTHMLASHRKVLFEKSKHLISLTLHGTNLQLCYTLLLHPASLLGGAASLGKKELHTAWPQELKGYLKEIFAFWSAHSFSSSLIFLYKAVDRSNLILCHKTHKGVMMCSARELFANCDA
jgi:hypothetical protein